MMITIMCAGSRGDFQPYIALAQRLKSLNLDVRISGFKEHENFVRGYGIDFIPVDVDYASLNVDPKMLKDAGSSDNPLKMLLTFNKMKKYGLQMAQKNYETLEGSDVIVYHPGCTMGYFAAQEMNAIPVLASPFPLHQTKDYLSVVMYGKSKATPFNIKLSYRLIQKMLWMASSHSVKGYWKQRFNRLPQNFGAPYERVSAHHPALISCSNYVFNRPADYSEHIHQAGYWFVKEPEAYVPSKALADFLASGEKPVYIGFGSLFNQDELSELLDIILPALEASNQRAIISGMGELKDLPPHVFSVNNIPHTWLFKHVSAVCHHGGAGTTAAGFSAGVPSIIIPYSNDQFAWAHRAHDLGVSAAPIYRKDLTSQKLTDALLAVQDEIMIQTAKQLGENIAKEDGAMACAKVIERLLN